MARFKLVPYVIKVRNKDLKHYIRLDRVPTIRGFIDFIDSFNGLLNLYKKNVYIPSRE